MTLYRKYRPSLFSELMGQHPIKVTLIHELESDRVAHAYLFTGPRGVGKTTTARLLAKALNCEERQTGSAEPCNRCSSCTEIWEGRSLDVIEIDAASHTGVDHVRESIINNARVVPVSSRNKVFIIDEVHMLSLSAFNALLKTLEEPPSHVVFILATTEVHRVPPTIISRCQRFDFKKVNVSDLVSRLQELSRNEGVRVSLRVLETIAHHASGSVRDAEGLLGQMLSLGEQEITEEMTELLIPRSDFGFVVELTENVMKGETGSAIEGVNRIYEDGVNLQDFFQDWLSFLRKILLIKISNSLDAFPRLELSSDINARLDRIIEAMKTEQTLRWIQILLEKDTWFKEDLAVPQLPLEIAIVEMTNRNEVPPLDPLEHSDSSSVESSVSSALSSSLQETPPVANIEIQKVKEQWDGFLKKIRERNHSLALTLRVSEVLAVHQDTIVLGFGYQFHHDVVWEKKNKEVVEGVLEEVFGIPLKIRCEVYEALRNRQKKTDSPENRSSDMVRAAIDTFGGELME